MTGTKFFIVALALALMVGCGSSEPAAGDEKGAPVVEKSQEDAMKAEGSIPN